jgi:hypothetical protein
MGRGLGPTLSSAGGSDASDHLGLLPLQPHSPGGGGAPSAAAERALGPSRLGREEDASAPLPPGRKPPPASPARAGAADAAAAAGPFAHTHPLLVAGAGVSGDLDEAVARLGVRFSFMGDGTPERPKSRSSGRD